MSFDADTKFHTEPGWRPGATNIDGNASDRDPNRVELERIKIARRKGDGGEFKTDESSGGKFEPDSTREPARSILRSKKSAFAKSDATRVRNGKLCPGKT